MFAVGAATSSAQRQDRSYYKSLYHFNADVELAEYSLPVLSNQQPPASKGATQKMPSGVINATQLPPISEQVPAEVDEEMEAAMDDYGVRNRPLYIK